MTPAVALTIAGSDSGGGAGMQADLRTFAALGVHGTCALTAITAQNTREVRAVEVVDAEMVVAQIEAVRADLPVAAAKTGMLATPTTVAALGELLGAGGFPPLVVDPVLVSSTGSPLMAAGGVDAYRELLLPHAAVATPNLREAAVLTGRDVLELTTVEAMRTVALELRALGIGVVVVKGGHLAVARAGSPPPPGGRPDGPDADSPDVVAGADGVVVLPASRVRTANDHGTGCSLAAAITARMAQGEPAMTAIVEAKEFVRRALAGAAHWKLGAGHGPIDHFGWSPDDGAAATTAFSRRGGDRVGPP